MIEFLRYIWNYKGNRATIKKQQQELVLYRQFLNKLVRVEWPCGGGVKNVICYDREHGVALVSELERRNFSKHKINIRTDLVGFKSSRVFERAKGVDD